MGFFYHLNIQCYVRLPIFAARFVVTFKSLAKTFQFLKIAFVAAIQDDFNLFFCPIEQLGS